MDLDKILLEKVKRMADLNKQLQALQTQIGGLKEQQSAIYSQGLELKGSIEALQELKKLEADALAGSKTAGLILPEGVKAVVPDKPLVEGAPANDAVKHPAQESSAVASSPAIPAEQPKEPIPGSAAPAPAIPLGVA